MKTKYVCLLGRKYFVPNYGKVISRIFVQPVDQHKTDFDTHLDAEAVVLGREAQLAKVMCDLFLIY